MIQLTYTLTKEEYIDYCYYLALHDKKVASKRRISYFGIPIAVLIVCMVFDFAWWIWVGLILLSFLISIFVINRIFRTIIQVQTNDIIKKQGHYSFTEMTLNVHENKIILKQKGKAAENYKLLDYILFEKIIILMCNRGNLIVPIRLYDTKEKIGPLVAYLEENLKHKGEN